MTTESTNEKQTSYELQDILEKTRKIGLMQDYIVEVALATYISKDLEPRNQLWLMVVGNPSSNKTKLVSLLKGADDVYTLDTMTTNPFISGMGKKDDPQDLLPLLQNKCLVIKDYTGFFSRSDDTVKQLIGDMVSIYDGEYAKHSGARGTVKYETSFSHIGCITPAGLNQRIRYMNMMGARFLFLRIPALSDEEKEYCLSLSWNEDFRKWEKEAGAAVVSFVNAIGAYLKEHGKSLEPIEKSLQVRLNQIAEFTARSRGVVHTKDATWTDDDGNTKKYTEITDIQIEQPFRALNQFRVLCESLAIIRGKEQVTDAEVNTTLKVALSTMPVDRADALSVFHKQERVTAKEASDILSKNYRTVKRCLDELKSLGVLVVEHEDQSYIYSVHPMFTELMQQTSDLL